MIRRPEDLLKNFTQVSSLPSIFTKINETINNPSSSTKDISDIISDDPGLTSRLLRLVNSSFYGFPTRVETVSRAIFIIGTQQIRDLALATSVISIFKNIPANIINMETFWKHSITCGLAARILGTYSGCKMDVERFFTAGIIHDIGRLIILKELPTEAHQILSRCKSKKELVYKVEQEVLGFDHSTFGQILLQRWNMPPSLEEVVALHHNPGSARRYPLETAIVHVADIIAHALQMDGSGEFHLPPLYDKAWASIGLPVSVLPQVLDRLEREVSDVSLSMLGKT